MIQTPARLNFVSFSPVDLMHKLLRTVGVPGMSQLGQKQTNRRGLKSTFVRDATNSDQFLRPSEMTLSANNRHFEHSSLPIKSDAPAAPHSILRQIIVA
jgi:hypothetical protein